MKTIPIINTNLSALVDDDDFDKLNQYNWYLIANSYAGRGHDGRRMHHDILNVFDFSTTEVHHKNNNTLDNQKHNLQVLKFTEHQALKGPQQNNKSGYKGVSWKNPQGNRKGKWVAQISLHKQKIHVGYYKTSEEAARAYDEMAIKLFGDTAYLNFPK